jgi:hypothetical protein
MSNCGPWLSIIPFNSRRTLRRRKWDSRPKNCSLDRRVPNEPPIPLPEVPEVPPPNAQWEPSHNNEVPPPTVRVAELVTDEVPPAPIQAAEAAANEVPPAPIGRTIHHPKRLIEGNILVDLTPASSIFGTLASRRDPHVPTELRAFTQLYSQLMEPDTGFLDTLHPWPIANPIAFAAKKTSDPDNPSLKEAMLRTDASELKKAMGI